MVGGGDTGRTMQALVQEGHGSADKLHLREMPRPELKPGRVLVRMRAASVNALDWHITHGWWVLELIGRITRQKDEPIRGVDLSGTVVAVAPDVTRFQPGDEVFGGSLACFAEYVLAREDRLLPKPAGLSFEEAATLNVAGPTALQALRDHGRVKAGQRVLIHGAGGGVGTFAVQIAKALGAHVTAVTGTQNVELVRSLGVDDVVDYASQDVTRRPGRYDAILDIAATRSIGDLRRVLAPDGTFVQVGAAKRGGWIGVFARIINVAVRARLLRQRVTFFVAQVSVDDMAYLVELIEGGKLRPVIDRTYPLAEGREAVRYVGTGRARAKVVITA
jgi:NADPH:quinone reductase-like Zn-dependent oxidoreductase